VATEPFLFLTGETGSCRGASFGLLSLFLSTLALAVLAGASPSDLDRDGLKDRFEQELLERFLPTFQISRNDCDALPAEFARNRTEPRAIARNGTIYGRVSPRGKSSIEIQYFHLWTRDCGLFSHRLDAEHVTVLVTAKDLKQPAGKWKAVYWYAGAHEDTLCENSASVEAVSLGAQTKGATVWISRGKHASYLDPSRCSRGCRTDDCGNSRVMPVSKVINLGEVEHPLNGSLFIHSRRWRLRDKMNEHALGR
jgi:hypothetical protein